jgi:hypothetical protein
MTLLGENGITLKNILTSMVSPHNQPKKKQKKTGIPPSQVDLNGTAVIVFLRQIVLDHVNFNILDVSCCGIDKYKFSSNF